MNIKKKIYLILGSIFFCIGILGYYLPGLPGTIFLIISAYCYMQSSKKLYDKIINNPVYGSPIKQYIENDIIPLKTKIVILLSIWITTLISIYIIPYTEFPIEIKRLNINYIINPKMLGIILAIIGTLVVLKTKNK